MHQLAPPPDPWRHSPAIYPGSAVPRHARWIQLDAADASLRTRPTTEKITAKEYNYTRTEYLHRCVKWIPVVSPRRSVFRATPWMRIYLSLLRSVVDPNSPLPRWKPAGINPNRPNRSWPRWWQTPKREDPTVKGSFWERYGCLILHVLVLLHHRYIPEAKYGDFVAAFAPYGSCQWLKFIISKFSRCDTNAGIGNDHVVDVSNLPLLCASLLNESGARCASVHTHDWQHLIKAEKWLYTLKNAF